MTTENKSERAALVARLETLKNALGAIMPDHYAVALADFAEAEAAKVKAEVMIFAQAANWDESGPRGSALLRSHYLRNGLEDRLAWPAIAEALRSPELDEMRARVLPLEQELEATRAEIARLDAEAETVRQKLRDELAAAEAAALKSKSVVSLREKLEALV